MKFFIIFFLIVGFTGAIRGSFKNRPAIRKWSHITSDNFLNKTIMNPLTHLQYAIKDFKKINKKTNITQFIGKLSPQTAAENYFDVTKDSSLSSYLNHTVSGLDNRMPNHIFLVIMESYDMWPLLPEYRSLGLGENLQYFGEKGIFFNRFLPSGESTMASVSTILTGAPYIGINISRIASELEPLPTSIPFIFEKLGYKTQLFYGGFLSWQNIGNLFQSQGFDNVFGSPHIEKNDSDIIWGVNDDLLFSFVEEKTLAEIKSFNVILTTSYHPPYNVDVEKFGFPLKNIPSGLISKFDGSMTMEQLGHIWYSDWAIGDFVKKIEKRDPESLFIFTGDHYGRRFINSHPTLYERSAVPLIIYGENFITPDLSMISTPGSHIDIIPTILSLIAPNQFIYQSFGNPLLQKTGSALVASGNKIGFGYRKIILDDYIIDVNNKVNKNIVISDGKESPSNKVLEIIKKQKLLFGLTWWRIFKGNILKDS
jgi:phosphoglycerol transferase MdoB-like AlkP superfamily enzyme